MFVEGQGGERKHFGWNYFVHLAGVQEQRLVTGFKLSVHHTDHAVMGECSPNHI